MVHCMDDLSRQPASNHFSGQGGQSPDGQRHPGVEGDQHQNPPPLFANDSAAHQTPPQTPYGYGVGYNQSPPPTTDQTPPSSSPYASSPQHPTPAPNVYPPPPHSPWEDTAAPVANQPPYQQGYPPNYPYDPNYYYHNYYTQPHGYQNYPYYQYYQQHPYYQSYPYYYPQTPAPAPVDQAAQRVATFGKPVFESAATGITMTTLITIGVSIFSLGVFSALFLWILPESHFGSEIDRDMVAHLCVMAITAVPLYLLFQKTFKTKISWRWPHWTNLLLSFGVFILSRIAAAIVVAILVVALGLQGEILTLFADLSGDLSGRDFNPLLLFLTVAVAVPVWEEYIFRGYFYNTLRKYSRFIPAAILSSFVFAIMHFANGGGTVAGTLAVVVSIFILSLGITYMFERDRSLWIPIIMHMLNNGIVVLLALIFSQIPIPQSTVGLF